jgi:beta-lactamase regulating signal transducer with metallopeptidase domain
MDRLLEIGLINAAAATVLALGAALAGRFVRRPALTHSLWVLVLLKLLAPPLVPLPVVWPERSVVVANDAVPDVDGGPLEPLEAELYELPPTSLDERWEPEEATPAPLLDRTGRTTSLAEVTDLFPWRSLLTALWLAGSALWLAVATLRILRFHRALRAAIPAPEDLTADVAWLADRLGLAATPDVRLVRGTISPLVWTLGGTARLLIPAELWDRLDSDQRTTLLIHELAHLRRRDHWVRALELVATGLFWWHPVVWWARRAMREAEEQCCDAWVVWAEPKAAKAYATALLETVDFLAGVRPALPPAASGIGRVEHLKRRLTMILKGMTPKGLSWAGRLMVLGLAGVLLPLAPTVAQDPPPPVPPQPPGAPALPQPPAAPITIVAPLPTVEDEQVFISEFVVDDDDDDADDDDKEKERKVETRRTRRVEVRTVPEKPSKAEAEEVELKAKAEAPEIKAELDKARAELRDAQQRLAKAAKRVAELEGKRVRARATARVIEIAPDGKRVVRGLPSGVRMPGMPPIPATPARPPTGAGGPIRDLEKRMSEMEQKLDKLMDVIKSQKKD